MTNEMNSSHTKTTLKEQNTENKNTEIVQNALEKLKHKLRDIKTLKNLNTDNNYLLRWLYSTDFDIEVSFIRIKDFHENMVENPNWFQKESPLNRKSLFDTHLALMLPVCDKEGRPIYICKLKNLDPETTSFADKACLDDIWYEYIFDKHPEIAGKGICMILDCEGLSWRFIKVLNYKDVKLSFRRLASLPFKEFKLHIVNKARYVKALLKFVMPFIPEESKKQLFLHFDDYESLYHYIDRTNLPPEYGGYNNVSYSMVLDNLLNNSNEILNKFGLYRNITKC